MGEEQDVEAGLEFSSSTATTPGGGEDPPGGGNMASPHALVASSTGLGSSCNSDIRADRSFWLDSCCTLTGLAMIKGCCDLA